MAKDKNEEWQCPICLGCNFGERIIEVKPNYLQSALGYQCNDCSVWFGDPKKFNKVRLDSCRVCGHKPKSFELLVNKKLDSGAVVKLCSKCFAGEKLWQQ